MTLQRSKACTLELHKERFNLKDILSNLIQDYRSQIEKKDNNEQNLKILDEPGNDNVSINADKVRITQVISNLINNSLKFTKLGKISITSKKNYSHVIVSVKDTGIGIDPEIMPKLFSKFATKSFSGTGLGLFISKVYCRSA